jgi:hypothetical protein
VGGSILIPDDLPAIRGKMEEVGARLLVVDPLVAHLPGSVNSWRDQDVRRALAPLARMADDLHAAVIVIVHLNKREVADVLSRISGSVGIGAAVRSILLAAPDPDPATSAGTRLLAHAKTNFGEIAPALRYRIEGRTVDGPEGPIKTSGIVWFGEVSGVRADDLLVKPTSGEEQNQREEAAAWLKEVLGKGPQPAKKVLREARENGISEGTLLRAKRGLGVKSVKTAYDGPWCWTLFEGDQPSPQGDQYRGSDHLRQEAGLERVSGAGSTEDDHSPTIDHLRDRDDHLREAPGQTESGPPQAEPRDSPDGPGAEPPEVLRARRLRMGLCPGCGGPARPGHPCSRCWQAYGRVEVPAAVQAKPACAACGRALDGGRCAWCGQW